MNQKKILSGTGVVIAAILATAIIILANSTLTSWRIDLTENKLFTLSDGTLNIIRSLDEPVTLDFYLSRKLLTDTPWLLSYATRVHDLLDEYAAKSSGSIRLNVIEPEPFSVEEDRAVANGLQGVPINTAGDLAYFGLVGTSSTDSEQIIPFFQSNREDKLEYDLTKLIYNLANPEKRTVGILSNDLPVFGNFMPGVSSEWAISQLVSEFFNIRVLDSANQISNNLDLLLVIHPKSLSELTLFAIDQYLLGGGKAMIFVDPMAEGDNPQPNPENPYEIPVISSNLETLFNAWGIHVTGDQVAADIRAAMRIQMRTSRGIEEVTFLPWLRLEQSGFNPDDFITSELNNIHMGSAGIIEKQADSTINFTPLIETSTEAMKLDVATLQTQRSPAQLLNDFVSENTRLTLAARISGRAISAFPDGMPQANLENPFDQGYVNNTTVLGEGDLNVVVVADTDILNDIFWINRQNFFGVEIPQAIADNGNFVVNALDVMSGSSDLISLRSRGEFSRPFTVVDEIRRNAEAEFRQQQQMLETKLAETEQKISQLQQERTSTDVFLSTEQQAEIEKFRQEQLNTRQELRAVQHELQKNIERLGTILKFINIGLIPLIIIIVVVSIGLMRTRHKTTHN